MSEGAFDPTRYLVKINGRADYLEVRYRLLWLRADHPDADLDTRCLEHAPGESASFWARVVIPGGGAATGHGVETSGDFRDYYEKAETKAIGRALAALGYGTQFCLDHDFGGDSGAVVDAPSSRPQAKPTPRAGTTPGREPAPRSSPQRPTPPERPAATPNAAGPPSAVTPAEEARLLGRLDKVDAHYNGDKGDNGGAKPAKRAPTVAEALTAARNEALSDKARQYAAVKGLEAAATRDEAAEVYTQLLRVVPDAEAFKAAYVERNTALGQLEEVPF
jgi:hypothetical protein